MAVVPDLIQPAQAGSTILKSAAVSTWSPATLGFDALFITPVGSPASPDILMAGHNSFMFYIHMAPAVAMSISLTVMRPNGVIILGSPTSLAVAALADQMVPFGAFSLTGVIDASGFVWWLTRFTVFPTADTTVTIRLFGAKR
jgi:hypothetical protein